MDCSGAVNSVDGLKILRYVAGLSHSAEGSCPNIGDGAPKEWGDVDCDGRVNSVDTLKILRYVAGLDVSQYEPCTGIGSRYG